MAKRRATQPISDALREAINNSGLPFLTLEQETGVKRQSLMKFMADEQSLRLDIADKLADYFGLELKNRKRR
jgi:plasmid maintenance system antidote protein VapI